MNLLSSCVLIAAAMFLVIHSTLSASIVMKMPLEDDVDAPIATRDAGGNKLSLLLTRFRRNIAQWYVGSHHFNEYNPERAARRWGHRRHNNHHHGGGQIVDA